MRKQTKRKVWSLVNPIAHAIDGVRVATDKKLENLRIRELAAIESYRTGQATINDWSDIVAMLNLSEVMGRNGVGPEVLETCTKAQEAMLRAAERFNETGRMGLTGEGLQAIRDLYEWHDLQRTSISLSQYERFIHKTANKMRGKEVTRIAKAYQP